MKFLLGKKMEMSQVFDEKGNLIPVTLIEAGPCYITQIKTAEKDKYQAVQIGFVKKIKKIKKPEKGKEFRFLKEFKSSENLKIGDEIKNSIFKQGEKVKISGINKGKGFQGAVKKWNFKGRASVSHGTKHELRNLGSVGMSFPERVVKGKKMAGRMGGERTTIKNMEIIKVDPDSNLLLVKGAVPGSKGTLLEIMSNS
ncbi:MAG: 50S ribosomal protein L3 [Candidatus Nealsonbacteria bacterium RBG_13_42_11]|uniref:Large ribosomal subunit protein uL3 n=1 Tax=Candidatus Nealsonbacteria bacterium RBG_13_42_11 TaxID=1801663 RepID=A0A1G2E0F9_9BACT|nr:MAG: 50S ribosomal protein L3 [Candidatus Nealsonbacteria bacterium RBG_13_42_11]